MGVLTKKGEVRNMRKSSNSKSFGTFNWSGLINNEIYDDEGTKPRNINDMDREAKEHGMSYGHYVAYLYSKQHSHLSERGI